jgi:branched-chain amino acid transport system substrate-binding protein
MIIVMKVRSKKGEYLYLPVLLVLVLATFSFLMGGCSPKSEEGGEIKLGALVSITGGLAHYGPHSIGGMELALEEVNYKVKGKTIKLIIEDDGSFDTVMALDKARKLVEADRVNATIGPIASGSFMAIEPYLRSNNMPNLSYGYRGEFKEWPDNNPGWAFSTNGSLAQVSFCAGQWALKKGIKTVTTLGHDYETGYQGIGGFLDSFVRGGGTVVQQQWAPHGTKDFGPYFANLKEADATVAWMVGPMMPLLVRQYYEFGLNEKQPLIVLATCSLFTPTLEEIYKDLDITGLIAATQYTWTIDTPLNKKFVADFEAKKGMKPELMANFAYNATKMYLAALEATGGDATPEKLREAMSGLTIDGPAGPLTFDGKKGYSLLTAYITEVRKVDGKPAYVVIDSFPKAVNPGYYTKP